ncbi:MAG: hypothetical protein OEY07_20225, partial [Gammaproteobacteria bacterium]|nr:hypothetical protein [Gammaproteobacteria bacterium]
MSRHYRIRQSLLLLLVLGNLFTSAEAMERRREQFTKTPGHYIVPMPYSLPGIGEGLLVGGSYNNANDSHTDYIGFVMTGDLQGFGLIAKDVHLLPESLIADFSFQRINKGTVNNYNTRGMNNGENDYTLLDFEDNDYSAVRLTSTHYDRMFELNAGALNGKGTLVRIRDKDGNLIQEAGGTNNNEYTVYTIGVLADWTDDYLDPRSGVRFQMSRWWRDESSSLASDYYQIEQNLTGYFAMGKRSTLVFNFFRADAFVTRQGPTDFAVVEANQGLNCSDPGLTAAQANLCTNVVNNAVANNIYGSVGSLGGWSRLRAYPNDRYKGAHALFWGTEFRWNLTEEFQPFDLWIARDVRTAIQVAFFYERASVADQKGELGNIWRESYGVGGR